MKLSQLQEARYAFNRMKYWYHLGYDTKMESNKRNVEWTCYGTWMSQHQHRPEFQTPDNPDENVGMGNDLSWTAFEEYEKGWDQAEKDLNLQEARYFRGGSVEQLAKNLREWESIARRWGQDKWEPIVLEHEMYLRSRFVNSGFGKKWLEYKFDIGDDKMNFKIAESVDCDICNQPVGKRCRTVGAGKAAKYHEDRMRDSMEYFRSVAKFKDVYPQVDSYLDHYIETDAKTNLGLHGRLLDTVILWAGDTHAHFHVPRFSSGGFAVVKQFEVDVLNSKEFKQVWRR